MQMAIFYTIRKSRTYGLFALLCFVFLVPLFLTVLHVTELQGRAYALYAGQEGPQRCDNVSALMKGPLQPHDPALIEVIRQKYLLPPSLADYYLHHSSDILGSHYKEVYPGWFFIDSVLSDFYTSKKGGFFVEAGALDGEFLSNTLRLEMEDGWTGLLVEPDKDNFDLLLKTNRKAWTSPTCFSTQGYPELVTLSKFRETDESVIWLLRATTYVVMNDSSIYKDMNTNFQTMYQPAQCMPAQSLLWALNVTHVDFFSLDIEMVEVAVLNHFPFDQITVDVWAIEHRRTEIPQRSEAEYLRNYTLKQMREEGLPEDVIRNREALVSEFEDQTFIKFMANKGYYYFDSSCSYVGDYIFVRKLSTIFDKLNVPKDKHDRTEVCKHKVIHAVAPLKMDLEKFRDAHHYPDLSYKEID